MPDYGLLARQGRREDNALMGGQVAHISAAEAEMLRRMGGAGTINPVTGLPEYKAVGGDTGATAYSAPGKSSGVGYGAGGVGPGPGPGWGGPGPGAVNTFAEAQLATIAEAKAQAKALGPDGQPLTNWADAVTSEGMQAIAQAGKDAYVKNAFDNFMDAAALQFAKYSPMLNLAEGANYLFGGQPTANPVTALGQYLYSSPSTTQSLSSGLASLVGNGSGESAATSASPTTGWYSGPGSALAPGSPGQITNPQPGELLLG